MVAVPDRLEESVREAQREDVVHRLLAQEVVDPEDLGLLEAPAMRALSDRAEARSWPKGFSQIMRAWWLRPVAPSISTIDGKPSGGTARWCSRRGCPPISRSASSTARDERLGVVGVGDPEGERRDEVLQGPSPGFVRPNSRIASRAWSGTPPS